MKNIIVIAIVVAIGWYGNYLYKERDSTDFVQSSSTDLANSNFKCDGRVHCSQMTSRAEAEFFVRNCPNTKMDGDRDGVPCENDSRF
ncbi:MAG: excalibur calcium-binding domain-containing protein [Candidatus Kapabacteria bacterium]|nr:excalibur calcium-binding domain-containing protein [Candidatus Kapabacteria bacterium]